jgi:hypothetical protein
MVTLGWCHTVYQSTEESACRLGRSVPLAWCATAPSMCTSKPFKAKEVLRWLRITAEGQEFARRKDLWRSCLGKSR